MINFKILYEISTYLAKNEGVSYMDELDFLKWKCYDFLMTELVKSIL